VNVTGEQIDTGHQGQGAVGVCTRDHASRLGGCRAVAGDPARSYRSPGSRASRRKRRWRGPTGAVLALGVLPFRPQHRHLPVDTQDLGQLGLELGIALFLVVTQLVRLDLLLSQNLADRPLGQLAQAWMPGGRSVLPCMGGEQPGSPQLVGITARPCCIS
jgi:hypothetical protein